MQSMEWRTHDKSEWGPGPWQDEPDKAQWTDEATGLPCLLVRNRGGALCGYVGVGPDHPLYGKPYGDADVECHGGLTFSDFCAQTTPENFERFMQSNNKRWPEVATIEEFEAKMEAAAICHKTEPGDFEPAWWFGFDCAHGGDASPAYDHKYGRDPDDTYKDVRYVKGHCASLARQLATIR